MKRILKKIQYKFIYAIRGIWITFREEKSLWVHSVLTLIVIGLGIFLKISWDQWAILAVAIGVVIGFEVMNTAIEALVDMISFEYNLKIKKIKDIAAGATLIVSLMSIAIGLFIFIPKIIERL